MLTTFFLTATAAITGKDDYESDDEKDDEEENEDEQEKRIFCKYLFFS